MDRAGLALVDGAILRAVESVDHDIRAIMTLARDLQNGDGVIDAGTLKTLEDLLFVAGCHLQVVNSKVAARLNQYRELAATACEVVEDLQDDAAAANTEADNVIQLFGAAGSKGGVA